MDHTLAQREVLDERPPGFWRSIVGVLIGVAAGNVVLVLLARLADWLGPPLRCVLFGVAGAGAAVLVPYVICRVGGIGREPKRAILRAFAFAAIPFGIALCAAKEALRLRDVPVTRLGPWQSFLWQHDRVLTRALLAAAFAAAAGVYWRGRRPASVYRAVVVTGVGVFLAWFAKEWLDVHRFWQEGSSSPVPTVWYSAGRTMAFSSANVFLSISLGITAMLLIWEWPDYHPSLEGRRLLVRNVALAVALLAFGSMAVFRPMVQVPRRMTKLLTQLRRTGALDAGQQAELLQFGAPAVEELKRVTHSRSVDPVARVAAVSIIAQRDDEDVVDFLLDLLHDASPEIRTRAFRVLMKKEPKRLADRLVEMLEDEWAEYRLFAATGLGTMEQRPAPSELVLLLQDKNRDVRCYAVWALGKIGDRNCVPELITALSDTDKKVRATTATALYRIGDKAAIPPLRNALGDESELVRYLSAEALGHLGDPGAVPVLVEAIEKGCGLRTDGGVTASPGKTVKVKISVKKMVEALAYVPAETALPALHDLHRRAPAGAKEQIAYAIDYVRQKDLERKMSGEP